MVERQKKWTQYTVYTKFFQVFFLHEVTINMNNYLDKLQLFAVPQTEHLKLHIILHQDGGLLVGV
jgi:hypothetical protein